MSVLAPPPTIHAAFGALIDEFVARVNGVWAREQAAGNGFGFSSWWRSRADNARVGGQTYSQHLLALAADTTPKLGADREAIKQAFYAAGLYPYDELDHIHVQAFPAGTIPREAFNYFAV